MKSLEVLKGGFRFQSVFREIPVSKCSLFHFVDGDELNPAGALAGGEFASGDEFAVEGVAAVDVKIVAALAGGDEPAVPGGKVEGAGHLTGGELPDAF